MADFNRRTFLRALVAVPLAPALGLQLPRPTKIAPLAFHPDAFAMATERMDVLYGWALNEARRDYVRIVA